MSTFAVGTNININGDVASTTSCCHNRLIKEILNGNESNENSFISVAKLQEARLSSNEKVLKLPSKNGVDRFSVVGDGSAEFVTIFNVAKTAKNITKCHSSVCKMLKGSSRNIKYLCEGNRLCPHLEEFKVFYNLYLRQTMHEEDDSDDEVEYEDSDDLEEGLPEEKVCGTSSCA